MTPRQKLVAGPPIYLNDPETAAIQVVVSGPPRTKKNHGTMLTVGKRPRLFPSKAWTEWCHSARITVNGKPVWRFLDGSGRIVTFPSHATGPQGTPWKPLERTMNVRATFYRDRRSGDAVGYYQGLADLLEKRRIVDNDSLLVSWDGSRLDYDPKNPRTEVVLTEAR